MSTVNKAYKFRLCPNQKQKALLTQTFGCCRFVYNHFLNERTKFYETHKTDVKKGLSYEDTSRMLTSLKKGEATLWLKDAPSQVVQRSLKNLDDAFKRFFRKEASYPSFKRLSNGQSCSFPQGFRVDYKKETVSLPKIGSLKFEYHREIPDDAKINYVTVSKNCSGEYYISLTVEEKANPLPVSSKSVGVDLGLIDVATLSTGKKFANPKFRRRRAKKLAYQQRQHSRKKKGSRRREKARIRLTKTHRKLTRQTGDFNHKISRSIVDDNQVICVENLNVRGMMKNRRLARSIGEVAWGELIRQLEYKCEWAGRDLVKVNRFFASSKTCSHCGTKRNLKLSERFWECSCGAVHDRDTNAATNILEEGLRILAKNKISSNAAKVAKDSSGEGLPSDAKQKLGEASRRVVRLDYAKTVERKRVCEPRCPQIHLWE